MNRLRELLVANLNRLADGSRLEKKEIARRAGITNVYFSYLLAGRNSPSFDICCRLANALEVEPEELFSTAPEYEELSA